MASPAPKYPRTDEKPLESAATEVPAEAQPEAVKETDAKPEESTEDAPVEVKFTDEAAESFDDSDEGVKVSVSGVEAHFDKAGDSVVVSAEDAAVLVSDPRIEAVE